MLTTLRSKAARLGAALAVCAGVMLPAACGNTPACAANSISSGRSYSPPSNSGGRSLGGSSGGRSYSPPSNSGSRSNYTRAPSNSGQRSSANKPSTASRSGTTRSFSYSAGGRSFSLPSTINTRSWRSPRGGTLYVYHSHSYYHRGGFHDLWNPYDWTNYYNPLSPWYQHAGLLALGPC